METFGWKSFRKLTKCYFLNIERKKFGWLSRKKSAGLSSCFLILHRNILQKKFLKSFCTFADFSRINCGNWAGKIRPACQNCILRIYRNIFWKKNCFWKTNEIFYHFQTLSRSFRPLSIFLAVCWNCILRVHRNTLGKKMSLETNTFPFFWDKNWFFFKTLWGKNSAGLSKMKFAGPKKNFASFFWKFILPIFFGHWPKVLRGFLRKISASLSKLDSLFQRKLSEKIFFSAKFTICFFLENRAENFRLTVGKISGGFEAAFYLSRGTFRKKSLEKFLEPLSTFFSIITGNCAGNVWWACQNCLLRIYWNNLKRKTVLENNLNFSSFLDS